MPDQVPNQEPSQVNLDGFDLDDALVMPEHPDAARLRAERITNSVSELPTIENPTGSCSICTESLSQTGENGVAKRLPCDHIFHQACITKWLIESANSNCPVCRSSTSAS